MRPALPATVTVNQARHPMEGRELRVLGWMRRHGQLELMLELPDGSKRLIPAQHTSLDGAPGGPEQGSGTLGLPRDLLAASELASAFSSRSAANREQAARKPPAREDDRAACPAQSAATAGSGATAGANRPDPGTPRRRGGHAAGGADSQDGGPGRDGDGR